MKSQSTRREKRKQLQELSKIAKQMLQSEATECANVNEVLIQEFYTDETHKNFNTFHGWKKEGYSVKKGEQAFLIWGKPKAIESKKEQQPEKGEDENKEDFYPLAYLFSNAQVQPSKVRESA